MTRVRSLVASAILLSTTVAAQANLRAPLPTVQQQLIHAVVQDEPGDVARLLDQGGDPNARIAPAKDDAFILEHIGDDDPAPPLVLIACRYSGFDTDRIVRALVAKGADVNIADKNRVTPLMVASQSGDHLSILLEHGAKVNVTDSEGRTPLMYAMNNFGVSTAATLLEKGAKINTEDASGRTALMIAIQSARYDPTLLIFEDRKKKAIDEKARYIELIQFLVQKKADVNRRDKAGNTALKLARASNEREIILLLKKAGARL